jgi:hypothetical protein
MLVGEKATQTNRPEVTMHCSISIFTITVLALTAFRQVDALEQPPLPRIEVTALVVAGEDHTFAILKDIGEVRKGQVVDFSRDGESFTLTVLSIDKSGVKVELKRHVPDGTSESKASAETAEQVKKPRDPFTPVNL